MGKILKYLAKMGALDTAAPEAIEKIIEVDKWEESKHPRRKDGKFTSGGGGGGGGGSEKGEKGKSEGEKAGAPVKEAKAPSKSGPAAPKKASAGKTEAKEGSAHTSQAASGSRAGKGTWEAPTKLSPAHEKKSVSMRDAGLQKKLSESSGDRESMKKVLDGMKPGTVLRYNERGYSLYTKQKDGSWTYQNAFSDHAQPTTVDKMFEDAQAWKDPKTGVKDPSKAFQGAAVPKEGETGRSAEWDARRALANLKPNPGDRYTGTTVTLAEAKKNAAERAKKGDFKEADARADYLSDEYTKMDIGADGTIRSAGVAAGKLKNGTGVTKIDRGDLLKANPDKQIYSTLAEHCMKNSKGELVLTPEREKLHQDIMEETFKNANPVAPGEKKIFTMLGGGSAAGKGTIQGMMPELFNQNSPVIDADEMKKRIPEYVDTSFSPDHESAASLAHEESSALAKRAIQTAFANGYNCTLDGTGDGSLRSMKKKIQQAQENGYSVEGVYVTCPTNLAVERNAGRSKTDEYNRLVNENAVREIHKNVSQIFPHVAPMMDHVVLYDTNQPNGAPPKKIAECWKGQKITVHDRRLYQAFLMKGKTTRKMPQKRRQGTQNAL